MKNFKKTQLIKTSKLVLIAITMVFVSCSNNEDDDMIKEQSITAANFESYTSYSDNGYTNIQFGDVINNSFTPIIKVENYNDAYNYSIVIKGDYLENEYKVALTFDKIDEYGETILKFDKAEFDAVPDTYQAYVLEEDSNTEVIINNVPNQGERTYYVYDADNSEYLYDIFFKTSSTNYTIPNNINLSNTFYLGYLNSVNFSTGLNLKLFVYDAALNTLGSTDVSSFGGTNSINGSSLSFITESGDYIFQIVGTPKVVGDEYSARKSTYKTMSVNIN
ncbi:hypothetical protein KO506_15325 [Polaribacter vadi]|uniref:hypothetical protein n=1 Tax=Polaribacter TaxID=52959 RepID=UPI001C0A59F5|nr:MULTISPECIES: hypothetical protein [Polaribacter]MBU3012784.1 hypothetical protein [Polaribacter vadi]MDO6742600.1 hypothetical protein [Polaribacter sp. 1_MG-2023]